MTAQQPEALTAAEMTAAFEVLVAATTAQAAAEVSSTYAAFVAGQIDLVEFSRVLLDQLIIHVGEGMAVGDSFAAAVLDRPPLGLLPTPEKITQLEKAVDTMVAELGREADRLAFELKKEIDLAPRLERLAIGESGAAAQNAVLAAYDDPNSGVIGYTRGTDSDPCELCVWLYKGGHVYPTGKSFHKHPGCMCVPVPVRKAAA